MNHPNWIEHLERNSRRSAQIFAVLVKYRLADWLQNIPVNTIQQWLRDDHGRPIPDLGIPARIRLVLTELGPTFIKLGQMLSTRPDLVGQEVACELEQLQSQTPPDSPRTALATVERELGHPVENLFAHFEPEAFASASIAQVHDARLHSGENVVVKVQKHGIEETIEADIGILVDLAELAQKHVPELRSYQPVALVRQFAQGLRNELDFTRERRNLEAFRTNFAEDDSVCFPRPWAELSSPRVITMERLEGILVSKTTELRAHTSDLGEFVRRGANLYLEMIFRDGFFHADPHPGNLMLLAGDIVGVLDCGMVQRLDEGLREKLVDVLLAVSLGDAEAMADSVWALGAIPPTGPKEPLCADCAELLGEYASTPINEIRLSQPLTKLTEIIRKNQIFLPPNISLLLRMLIELEGTAQLLHPAFSLIEVIEPYCKKALARRFSPTQISHQLWRDAHAWHQVLQQFPKDLRDLLDRIRVGTMSVHLEHRRLDPVVNRLVLGLVASSLFLGSSLLWSMKALPLIKGVSLFGAMGYLFALFLGLKLFRAVRSSEDLGSKDQ